MSEEVCFGEGLSEAVGVGSVSEKGLSHGRHHILIHPSEGDWRLVGTLGGRLEIWREVRKGMSGTARDKSKALMVTYSQSSSSFRGSYSGPKS